MSSTVVLVDHDKGRAVILAQHLEDVGFSVRCEEIPDGEGADTMVWMAGGQEDRTIVETVRMWLGARSGARAVIVCDRPHLRGVIDTRVWVVPAPIQGCQLVDVLRAASPMLSPQRHRRRWRRRRR